MTVNPPGAGVESIGSNDLDPLVLSLGELLGLLVVSGDQVTLQTSWFEDPISGIRTATADNPDALISVVSQILGEIGGNALGIPVTDPGLLGTWYPIPVGGKPTGLYLVAYPDPSNADVRVLGFGAMARWEPAPSTLGDGTTLGIVAEAWGMAPLLKLGGGQVAVALGAAGTPLTVGLSISGADGADLFDGVDLSLAGIRASGSLDLAAADPLTLTLLFAGLKLPEATQPADVSLADLEALTADELLSVVAALALSALAAGIGSDPRLSYVLPALGLAAVVPGVDGTVPPLGWAEIARGARAGNAAQPLLDWFLALASDPKGASAWLTALAGLVGVAAPTVSGAGTREDPLSVALFTDPKVGAVAFTLGTRTDSAGNRSLYPGVAYHAVAIEVGGPVALTLAASLELAELDLSASGTASAAGPSSLHGMAGLVLANKTAGQPLFSGTIDGDTFSFGSLRAGLALSDGLQLAPTLQLVDLDTPTGGYPVLDLTDPTQIAQVAVAELCAEIVKQLGKLLGITDDPNAPFGSQVASLIGLTSPKLPAGVTWPLVPPLSAAGLPDTVADPFGSLSRYYQALPITDAGGRPAIVYLLADLAALLAAAGAPPVVITGTGTAADPWCASLAAADLVRLVVYRDPGTDAPTRLTFGLQGDQPLQLVGAPATTLSFRVDLVSLAFGPDGVPGLGAWLPHAGLSLTLPEALESPKVAGATLGVTSVAVSAGWSSLTGWAWDMRASAPYVKVGTETISLGTDLVFSDTAGLAALVTTDAARFAPMLVRVLGVFVARTGSPVGLAVDGVLGLLPDLGPSLPDGLDWPADMPTLTLTDFSDPLGAIRSQLAALTATQDRLLAVAALVAWAFSPDGKVQVVSGSGTIDDPVQVPVGLPIDLWLWSGTGGALGIGAGRKAPQRVSGLTLTPELSIRAVEVPLTAGAAAPASIPSLVLKITVSSGSDALATTADGLPVLSLTAGVQITVAPDGAVVLTPDVSVGIGGDTPASWDAASLPQGGQQAFTEALDLAFQAIVLVWHDDPTFGAVYDLLVDLGLALERPKSSSPWGLSPGGWNGLWADPTTWLVTTASTTFASSDAQQQLRALLADVLEIPSVPQAPEPLLRILHALDIVSGPETGWLVLPQAVVAIARHPADELVARAEALLSDPVALEALIGALAGSTSVTFGPFVLSIADGTRLTLTVPVPYDLGGVVDLGGTIRLDLRNATLETTALARAVSIGVGVRTTLEWALATKAPRLESSLVWGQGDTPAGLPITVYPFDESTFVEQLIATAPTQVLSAFVGLVFDPYVIQPYPLARAALLPLGLLVETPGGEVHLKSLIGLFDDPVGWLLSDAVVGRDGSLDLATVAKVLAALPPVTSPSGVALGPVPATVGTGVALTGLPYGLGLTLAVDPKGTRLVATGTVSAFPLGASTPVATLDLGFGVSLDATWQPGVSGAVTLTQPTTELGVSAGYDAGFTLALALPGGASLALLPFGGWQSLVQAAAQAAAVVVQELTDKLLTALAEDPAVAPFVARLRALGTALDVNALVVALSKATTEQQALDAALGWLQVLLTPEAAAATVAAVLALLQPLVSGLGSNRGLLTFTPSAALPLTLSLGIDQGGLIGLWAELAVPENPVASIRFQRTGVGFEPVSGWPVTFSFGLDLLAPIVDAATGPALAVAWDSTTSTVRMTLDPQQQSSGPSDLAVELLPEFFGGKPDAVGPWIIAVLVQVLPRYGSLVVLGLAPVEAWLDAPIVGETDATGAPAPSPGDILIGAGLLQRDAGRYVMTPLDQLLALTPEAFVAGLLKSLLARSIRVFPIGTDGGIFLEQDPTLGYGARIVAPDLVIDALPQVVFQIGATDVAWIEPSGGPANARPGAGVYVPIPGDTPQFDKATLQLLNIGLDVRGKNQAPLVQLSRFELGAIGPRALLVLPFAAPSSSTFGGALNAEDLGFAVAPNTLPAGVAQNPVAANLLGSGSPSDPTAANPATDPTTTVIVAYTSKLWAGFVDAAGDVTDRVTLPVQQSFGPLSVQDVGFRWYAADEALAFLFTGGVALAGLAIGVVDLSVTVPVTAPTDFDKYSLGLRGLAVSFESPSVTLAGGLLQVGDAPQYDGMIVAKVSELSIAAVGSYALVQESPTGPKSPSFFVFAAAGAPIGGDPSFFVRGFAGGFGFNRDLLLPGPAEVPSYILVAASLDPEAIFGTDPKPMDALEKLHEVVSPKVGAYWAAAGIHFTTYALLDSVALLVVGFGDSPSISLLGVSRLTLPPLVEDPSLALLYVELGLVVTIQPTVGLFSAQAQLTPNSFVLDRACRLTGGFAFFVWWSPNAWAGDFVLTLGGYNPNYDPPAHYPKVPRLGLSWPMDVDVGSISITGGAYFALTPNAIMAGGGLDLEFRAGPLRAWFVASADFLIEWAPFYYDIRVEISVGVAFTTTLFGASVTLKAELGAGLELWGPPTRGRVHVSWYILSFSIPIGSQDRDLDNQPLGDWDAFAQRFLPAPAAGGSGTELDTAPDQPVVLKLVASRGLVDQSEDGTWTIARIGFTFRAQSSIPMTRVAAGTLPDLHGTTGLGVRPMDIATFDSTVTFTLTRAGSPAPIGQDTFTLEAPTSSAPMALWDPAPFDHDAPPGSVSTLPGVMLAATLSGLTYEDDGTKGPIDLAVFDHESIADLPLPLSTTAPYAPADPYPASEQDHALATLMATLTDPTVSRTREALLGALRALHLDAPASPHLDVLAAQADNVFQAPPVLARLAQTLAAAPSVGKRVKAVAEQSESPAQDAAPPRLVALARRYTTATPRRPGTRIEGPRRTRARWLSHSELPPANDPVLRDGGLAVFRVDASRASRVTIEGDLPTRLLGFDRRGELVFDNRCGRGTHTLPGGLEHTVASAEDPLTTRAGWDAGTRLLRVSARYFAGESCLVRPQAVARRVGRAGEAAPPLEALLDGTGVRTADGVRGGWITTLVPVGLDRAVICASDAALEVAVLVREDGRLRRQALVTRAVPDAEGATFEVDLAGHAIDGWCHLMVRARGELRSLWAHRVSQAQAVPAKGATARVTLEPHPTEAA